MSFFQNLWGSIFEPGANPQLLIATHLSFTSLILVLVWLCYETRNIHFFALLTIASILWALVTWFMNELKNAPLKDNDQLAKDNGAKPQEEQEEKKEKNKNKNKNKKANQEPRTTSSTASNSSVNSRRTRSRKT
ncbi:hypothetical protein ZYGR_0AF02980 [Zygosaccharomyces rouxii]|uniref:V-type ATPase assembly factor PKR1 n=1 Tax=Zygosaccharomyces rouxii TaxID=4956 RepID=A0A1Q3A835_ZYGRO|nr:hypothetical protein ZYGR_0AF02980 [Zygosaccharomyces rouxii]